MQRESRLSPAHLRAMIPAATRTAYLAAAAASPLPRPVERAVADHYRELAEWGDVGFQAWLKRKEEVRAQLARFLGASPEEVAFTSSTSMGMSVAAHMLKQLGVREVVTLEGEFPSTTLPLLQQGLKLRLVPPRPDGSYPVEDVAKAVRKTTGALVASAVQYSSGYRLDLQAASKLCRSRGLYFVVNGSQALGQVPVDVARERIDILAAAAHKWVMGGYGMGIFFARRKLLKETQPPLVSWLSPKDPLRMDNVVGAKVTRSGGVKVAQGLKLRDEAAVLEMSGPPFGLIFGLGAALDLHERMGIELIQAHIGQLQGKLREWLRSRGFVPNAPDDEAVRTGICTFNVHGQPKDVVHELAKRGVIVTARGGGVRVSTHIYNNEDDLEQFFRALESLGVLPSGDSRVRVGA